MCSGAAHGSIRSSALTPVARAATVHTSRLSAGPLKSQVLILTEMVSISGFTAELYLRQEVARRLDQDNSDFTRSMGLNGLPTTSTPIRPLVLPVWEVDQLTGTLPVGR